MRRIKITAFFNRNPGSGCARRVAGRILRDIEIDFLDLFRRLGGNFNPVRHRVSNRAFVQIR